MATSLSSAIHNIQLSLLETPSTPTHLLFSAAALLSRPDYSDVVTERSIADLCGYPSCPNPLPPPSSRSRRSRYRVSLREHRVFDLEETYKFCSDECHIASAAFAESLWESRRAEIDVGRRKIEEVMGLFRPCGASEDGGGARLGVSGKLVIRERSVGGGGEVTAEEWIGPSNAIEGYVPLTDRGSKSLSNLESVEELDYAAGSDAVDFTSSIITGDEMDGDLTKESSDMARNISESIAKSLNNMAITPMKTSHGTSSNPSSHKFKPMATDKVTDKYMDFTSEIIIGDEIVPSFQNKCLLTTEDVSEFITKQLENVSIAQRKAATAKTSSKTRPKARKKPGNKKSDKMISEGNNVNAVPSSTSASSQGCSKQSVEGSKDSNRLGNRTGQMDCDRSDDMLYTKSKTFSVETQVAQLKDGIYLKEAAISQATTLKSSLKTSESKAVKGRTVKWADNMDNEALEDRRDAPPVLEEDSDSSLRLASAEACVAALTQAAEAVASGDIDAEDAVEEAGIVILPQAPYENEGNSEADEDAFEFDRGVQKWPKKTVLLDTDMFDVEDSWHDTPPEGFSLSLSTFATMWMALFEWITCSSLAYIYGHDDSSQEDFLLVNGREYPRKIYLIEGRSDEIKLALSTFITRALPTLVMDLRLSTPVSTLEKFLGRLLDTMTFSEALPSFRMKQWQVIVLLFIEALSVHRLPSLTPHITSRNMLLHKVLTAAQVSNEEYETMRDLIMPLGRLPQFSMQRGA